MGWGETQRRDSIIPAQSSGPQILVVTGYSVVCFILFSSRLRVCTFFPGVAELRRISCAGSSALAATSLLLLLLLPRGCMQVHKGP